MTAGASERAIICQFHMVQNLCECVCYVAFNKMSWDASPNLVEQILFSKNEGLAMMDLGKVQKLAFIFSKKNSIISKNKFAYYYSFANLRRSIKYVDKNILSPSSPSLTNLLHKIMYYRRQLANYSSLACKRS